MHATCIDYEFLLGTIMYIRTVKIGVQMNLETSPCYQCLGDGSLHQCILSATRCSRDVDYTIDILGRHLERGFYHRRPHKVGR